MNHGWEIRPLQDICNKASSNLMQKNIDSENGKYPVFGASGIAGYIDYYVQAKDYIGIIKDGSGVGRVSVYPKESSLLGTLQYIIPNENMDLRYVAYALKSMNLAKYVSGAAIPHIYFRDYGEEKIAVPSIKTQSKVADELDKLNELIEIKRNQIKDLDALAQSLFYETFGEPFINSKGWPIMNFGDLASSINYGTSLPAVDGGYYPYIRMNNLTDNGYLDLSNLKYIDIPESELDKCLVRKGDILFNRTNSREKVGKSALFDRADKMVIAGYIIRVRAKADMLNPVFAVRYLNLPELKEHLRKICRGAVNQANINSKEMASIPFIVPPINLQNQFASKIEAIEAQKKLVEASIADLETLFASRMDFWFND